MLKKLLSAIMISLLLVLCCVSCNSEPVKNTEAQSDEKIDATTTPPQSSKVKTAVKVLYPDGSPKKVALKLQDKILSIKGASVEALSFCTLSADAKTEDDGTFEILVGNTDREISSKAYGMLKTYLDFAILFENNKLAIAANTEERMLAAVEKVLTLLEIGDTAVSYVGPQNHLEEYTDYPFSSLKINGNPIANYSVIYSGSADNFEKQFAESLAEWLMSASGTFITLSDDSAPVAEFEILIGATNRPESSAVTAAAPLPDGRYATALSGSVFAVSASSSAGYTLALERLQRTLADGSGELDAAFSEKWLTFDEIREISVGSPNIKEQDGALYFYKCTDAQLAEYRRQGTGMENNATSSTGVRLDFITDSTTFAFKAANGTKFELFINGVQYEQIDLKVGSVYSTTIDTGKSENRLTLVLPNHQLGAISMIQLDGNATLRRQEFDLSMLIIGDSITQGFNTPIDSKSYGHIVSMHYNADSMINGVGGGIFNAAALDYFGDGFEPDVIIVAYGTNDWDRSYSESTIRNNMKEFLHKLLSYYPDAKIFGITPLWRTDYDNPETLTLEEARAVIADVYEEYGVTVIDGYQILSHDPAKLADNVHPNTEGFEEYAENLIKELDKHIK